jgi:predicted enzyme related to lactoylglutathione lyase
MANAFVHIELSTDDLAKAKKFYKTLFDWKVTDMPDMSYAMINVGKGTGGGMMKKQMPEQPTMWLPYIEVDSVKKTVAKAKKAGATAMVEYMEISGGMGAFGVLMDPTGAAFGVWEKAKSAPRPAKKAAKKKKTGKR